MPHVRGGGIASPFSFTTKWGCNMKFLIKRILPVLLCVMLCFITLVMPIHKAKASAILVGLGIAAACVILSVSYSMIAGQSANNTLGEWVRNIDWVDFQQQAKSWASDLTLDSHMANYSPETKSILLNTDWNAITNEETGEANLTHDQVAAIKEAVQTTYPQGVPIKKDSAATELGIKMSSPTMVLENSVPITLGTGGRAATGNITRFVYDGISLEQVNSNGSVISTFGNVSCFMTNVTNVNITGSYGYTYNVTPIVFCVTGSDCYNYLLSNPPWGRYYNDASVKWGSKQGFITVMGSTGDNTGAASTMVSGSYPGNTETSVNIINGTDDFGVPSLVRMTVSGVSKKTNYRVTSVMSVPEVIDRLKIRDAEYNAMITAWANSISAGQTANTDKLVLSMAQSNAELAQQLQGTVSQSIQATNAQTAQLVDAINAAVAAAAAASAVGELDLSKMTLGQNLMMRFPFCIPFDLAHAFEMFRGAGTTPPIWHVKFDVCGREYGFDIDMTMYEPWAIIVRWGILVAFNIGLILVTRKIIKG